MSSRRSLVFRYAASSIGARAGRPCSVSLGRLRSSSRVSAAALTTRSPGSTSAKAGWASSGDADAAAATSPQAVPASPASWSR